ncbi:hypothetical protein [Corynebacterium callunae]|uniref:Uncharacterized protein n=1 Tax=Corynebacterium callunae DSM 20147 TaxID=1121353 RepID=M1UGK3_9CORY|nr:hypothetical protein [Corynebacterium callunae]AGG67405.1 hypothetical protein H924_09835 [Corynebacterium callunae DSM 20147]MCK2199280.1 hypothetical protein [Corynebacterium callunae]
MGSRDSHLEVEFSDLAGIKQAVAEKFANIPEHLDAESIKEKIDKDFCEALVLALDPNLGVDVGSKIQITRQTAKIMSIHEIEPANDDNSSELEPFSINTLIEKSAMVSSFENLCENYHWPLDPIAASEERMRIDVLKGLLWQTSRMLTDDLFYDLEILNNSDSNISDTQVISMLPAHFAEHYAVEFVRRFLVCVVEVSRSLTGKCIMPPTMAHALALHVLFEQAAFYGEFYNLPLPIKWRDCLNDLVFKDIDIPALYSPDPVTLTSDLHLLHHDFLWWFTPLHSENLASPYTTD